MNKERCGGSPVMAAARHMNDGGTRAAVLIWICILAAIALIAKNFGGISSPDDLLSFDGETGKLTILGESIVFSGEYLRFGKSFLKSLSDFWISFTPLRLFSA